jgi:microcin C transport system ATP-binding protein
MRAFPHQLSGGQRQRVMIAMALACHPSLLIADEPTTALDVSIQAQILDLIQDLQQEYHMALLLITHDLGMVRKISDHIHIMKDGRIVEHGATETVFSNPRDPYTIHLMDSVPGEKKTVTKGGKVLLQTKNLSCHFHLKSEWQGLFKRKKKIVKAVDNVNLIINRGTTCGLVGESGSGKTTLGMAILKLTDSTGEMLFNNQDLQPLSNSEMRPLRKNLQVVFQDPFSSLSPRLTVGQIIAEGMKIHHIGENQKEREEIIKSILLEVGLEPDTIHRYPHEFSGGQRQRIAIARSIVLRPDFLILDEPTSALDMTIQKQVIQLLKGLQKKYQITYLFISHDLRVIRTMADQVVVMQNGQIVESGSNDEIFTATKHSYTKKLFSASLHETNKKS